MRRHLTYANVASTLALFFAVAGGSAYAAKLIASKDVKDNSLTTIDVKDKSLLAKDFKAGQLPAGATGPAGPAGAKGAGPAGPTGAKGDPGEKGDKGDTGAAAPVGPTVELYGVPGLSGVAVPDGVNTTIGWNTEIEDASGFHSGTLDTVTVPAGAAGLYAIEIAACWPTNTAGIRVLLLRSGTKTVFSNAAAPPNGVFVQKSSGFARLAAGDTLKLNLYQSSGTTLTVGNCNGNNDDGSAPSLQLIRLAP